MSSASIAALSHVFIFGGMFILIMALLPMRKLLIHIRGGEVYRSWVMLMGLTVVFILGYLVYGIAFWNSHSQNVDLIVPGIFLAGSIFVWFSAHLSLQTAIDVHRISMLEQESVTDPLTGIFNRRYMERRLHEEFSRAERYRLPFSILLIDVDNFKGLNDIYGHQVGDLVLVELTHLILGCIRATDVVARYGGDEFMVIASNTTEKAAYRLADRIRQQVEDEAFDMSAENEEHVSVHLTISIGISSFGEDIESIHTLIHCADEAMYQAKKEGRNRTITARAC